MTSTNIPEIISHHARCAEISKSYWRKFESYEEHAGRVSSAEHSAWWFFNEATVAQKRAWDRAMADLRGLIAPRYDRAREAANRVWYASTADARALYEQTFEDFMRDGDISEATSELWDALDATAVAA